MGLQDLARKLAQVGVKIAGNIALDATFTVRTDDGIAAPVDTNYTTKVVLTRFSAKELAQPGMQLDDVKGLIARRDLSVSPTGTHRERLTVGSDVYTVIGFNTDPAEAMWILQLRKS